MTTRITFIDRPEVKLIIKRFGHRNISENQDANEYTEILELNGGNKLQVTRKESSQHVWGKPVQILEFTMLEHQELTAEYVGEVMAAFDRIAEAKSLRT